MTLRELSLGELVDIIEWVDESGDTMAWRFSRPNNEIKNGAQLIVRPAQVAIFVDRDTSPTSSMPGRHVLVDVELAGAVDVCRDGNTGSKARSRPTSST